MTQKQTLNSQAEELITENHYDELGQLDSKGVGGKATATTSLQTIDYTYNIRGWLKRINTPGALGDDLFGFELNYNSPNLSASTPLYNGNISETRWETANDHNLRSYAYTYDGLNRLTAATDNTGHYNLDTISYDKNGNILNLQRQGHTNANATTFGMMDNLTYSYDSGNKLTKVVDTGNALFGFKEGNTTGDDYDPNGNMTEDKNKKIKDIEYNHLNLPTKVEFTAVGKETPKSITYVYDATGIKLSKRVNENTSSDTTTQYAGNYIYNVNGWGTFLQFFSHAEGYTEPNTEGGFDYVYQYKDQINNVRLSYSDLDGNGSINPNTEILHERNYYPFGLKHKGYNNVVNGIQNNFMTYNGVELEESLGLNLYEMEFRQYDPAIARFTSIDPIVHFDYSTYSAFDNNPVFYADPSGADSESFIMDLFNNSESGTTWTNNNDGTFSDGNGNTQDCDECKTLIAKRKKLETRLEELNVSATNKKKWVDLTRDLTSNGAIANVALEYIDGISKLTDEQIEYFLNNPQKMEQHVLEYIVQYELDLALGDRKISAETKNKTEAEIGQERLNRLKGLTDRGIALSNLANTYVNAATQIMHRAAQGSQAINSAERLKVKNDLSKVNKRLKELSPD